MSLGAGADEQQELIQLLTPSPSKTQALDSQIILTLNICNKQQKGLGMWFRGIRE